MHAVVITPNWDGNYIQETFLYFVFLSGKQSQNFPDTPREILFRHKVNFSQWEQSASGIISPGKCWIPQHWTLRFSHTGCWTILFQPWFCQEKSCQIILEILCSLVFHGSGISYYLECCLPSLFKDSTGKLCSHCLVRMSSHWSVNILPLKFCKILQSISVIGDL